MKTLSLFLLTFVVYTQAIQQDELLKKWSEFQTVYKKNYRSSVEARKRFAIFKDKLEEIEAHNLLFEQGKTSYTKGINQFADKTSNELMQYVNKGFTYKNKFIGDVDNKISNFKLPESVDWRKENGVTPVKDQGMLGSSWSFSVTGTIEGQLGIVKRKLESLSEQNLNDCVEQDESHDVISAAYNYVKDNGIENENVYPRMEYDTTCRADPSKIVTKISKYVYLQSGNESALQNAIAAQGPTSVAIDATEALLLYSTGILDDKQCSSTYLNHYVLAVGYGSENGEDFYILKNSWGEQWGESGYFRLLRNSGNRCGVATTASYTYL